MNAGHRAFLLGAIAHQHAVIAQLHAAIAAAPNPAVAAELQGQLAAQVALLNAYQAQLAAIGG